MADVLLLGVEHVAISPGVTRVTPLDFGNIFGQPPPSVRALAWVGQAQWLLIAWGYWVDRHRKLKRVNV